MSYTREDLLKSIRTRSGSRLGIGTADAYLKSLDGCFDGGLCPRYMKGVSGEQWSRMMKDAADKLTYCAPGMNIKGNSESSTPGFLLDFNCIISTNRKDRDGDVLLPEGATLDPMAPLLWQHNPLFPIGKVFSKTVQDRLKIGGRCGIAEFKHDGELAAMSRDAATLVQCNALRISHGFDPKSFKPLDQEDGRWLVSSYEILEVSLVSIPSNVGAIIESFSRGKLHSPIVKGWAKSKFDARPVQGRGVTFDKPACSCQTKAHQASGKSRLELKADESDPIRWNKSLSKTFDVMPKGGEAEPVFNVSTERLRPAGTQYDWASKYLEVAVKNIFETNVSIPSARMGSWLMAFRELTGSYTTIDVRNIGNESEYPPVYEEIQLKSDLSDTFLVQGTSFYKNGKLPIIVTIEPTWSGINIRGLIRLDQKQILTKLIADTWELARRKNYLKGEAFSLSGEFLNRDDQAWEDVFLEEKNMQPMLRMLKNVNEKQAACPNRGMIFMGNPGTGKTLSGRVIKNQANATYIWVSARDFHRSGSFGGFAYAFELSKELAPSILFLEDVDNWMDKYSVDLLKTEMDGLKKSAGLVTILTTNFPEQLPEALIDRPGRFHDVLKFGLPGDAVRVKMLEKWIPEITGDELRKTVERTKGYSGAHIYELASFARNLSESDELAMPQAVVKALDKIDEQRDLITQSQLAGSHYRPRRDIAAAVSKAIQKRRTGMSLKEMQSETTQEINRQQTPAPKRPIEEEGRLRGEGPQQGDDDFAERYNSEDVEQQPVDRHPGTASTNPLGSSLSDTAGQIATGASGARMVEGTDPLRGEQNDAATQTIATGGGGKSLKDVNDSMDIQPLDADTAAHHGILGNVNSQVDVDIPGLKSMAMNIKHCGKAGHCYLNKSMGAVHHVMHADDFSPEHVLDYHQPGDIEKMYKCVRGVKCVKCSPSHPMKEHGYEMIHRPGTSMNPDNDKGASAPQNKAGRMLSQRNVSRLTTIKSHLEHVHSMPMEHASNQAKAIVKAAHGEAEEMLKDHRNVSGEVEFGSSPTGIAEDMGDEPTDKTIEAQGDEEADSLHGPAMDSVGSPLAARPPVVMRNLQHPSMDSNVEGAIITESVSFEINALKCLLSVQSCKDWELAMELVDTIRKAKQEFDLEVELRSGLDTSNGLAGGSMDGLGSDEELRATLMRELSGTVAE